MATDLALMSSLLRPRGARRAGSLMEIANTVEAGLPVSALTRVMDMVAPDDGKFADRIVPRATLSRRRGSHKGTLSAVESNTLARVVKVWAMAMRVWDDEADVREFLRRPHPMLDGRAPRDVAVASDIGADAVINLIGRGAYGGGV